MRSKPRSASEIKHRDKSQCPPICLSVSPGLDVPANDSGDAPASAQSPGLRQTVEPLFKVLEPDAGGEEITQWKDSLLEEHELFMVCHCIVIPL